MTRKEELEENIKDLIRDYVMFSDDDIDFKFEEKNWRRHIKAEFKLETNWID